MTQLPESRSREPQRVDASAPRVDSASPDPRTSPALRRASALLVVLALAVAVAFLALRSSPYLQHVPWIPRDLGRWADRHGILRNVVAFFVLGLVALTLLRPRLLHVGLLCLFGTSLEVAQIWIPGRIFDLKDIVATIAGILLAWPAAWLIRRLW